MPPFKKAKRSYGTKKRYGRKYKYGAKRTNKNNPKIYPRYQGRQNGPEYKYMETSDAQRYPTNLGYITSPLGQLTCGPNANQRIGNKITVKSYQLKATCTLDPATVTGFAHLRILILLDKQPNAALPTIASIFPATADRLISGLSPEVWDRYSILTDKQYFVSNAQAQSKYINIFKKLNMSVDYANAATAIPGTNAIHVLLISNEPAGGNPPVVIWTERIRYTDV